MSITRREQILAELLIVNLKELIRVSDSFQPIQSGQSELAIHLSPHRVANQSKRFISAHIEWPIRVSDLSQPT